MSIEELVKENELLKKKLFNSYDKKSIVYIGLTEKNICKFGFTNDAKTRLLKHKSQINKNFTFDYVVETIYNREVEKDIKINLAHRVFSKKYKMKNQTELIQLDEELTIHDLYELILTYKNSYNDKEIITKLTSELEELYLKKEEKEEEIEEIEEEIEEIEENLTRIKGTEFACSICQYTSCKKDNVIRHIQKKKSCGVGIKEIIEIPIHIACEFCNKNFLTKQNLQIHFKKYCRFKKYIANSKNIANTKN